MHRRKQLSRRGVRQSRQPQLGQSSQFLDSAGLAFREQEDDRTPPPGAAPRTRAPAPRTDRAIGRHPPRRSADAPPLRWTASSARPARREIDRAARRSPGRTRLPVRRVVVRAAVRDRPAGPRRADASPRREAPSPIPPRLREGPDGPRRARAAYFRRADLPMPGSPRRTSTALRPELSFSQQLDRASHTRFASGQHGARGHGEQPNPPAGGALAAECHYSARRPPAVVTCPEKTNVVWRNDASRSKGSSAEIASRGITTAYQRSAALAAV